MARKFWLCFFRDCWVNVARNIQQNRYGISFGNQRAGQVSGESMDRRLKAPIFGHKVFSTDMLCVGGVKWKGSPLFFLNDENRREKF